MKKRKAPQKSKAASTRRAKAMMAKMIRQNIGQAESAQVVRMISQRLDYLKIHGAPGVVHADRVSALEQIAVAVMRVKFR